MRQGTCGSGAADDSDVELFVKNGALAVRHSELGFFQSRFGRPLLISVEWAKTGPRLNVFRRSHQS